MYSLSSCFSFGKSFVSSAPRHGAAFDHRSGTCRRRRCPTAARRCSSEPGACSTHGGISQPVPTFRRYAFDRSRMPLSPLFQLSRQSTTCCLRRARLQAHERVREVVADVVELRREVVRLGLAFLADELGLLGVLVHVVRDRPHVVEELRVDRPLLVLLPDVVADDLRPEFGHGVAQQELVLAGDDVAQPFVGLRLSLAASVVEANQRSSMPPRCVPRA